MAVKEGTIREHVSGCETDEQVVVEIESTQNGVFHFRITSDPEGVLESLEQGSLILAHALAWWRGETNARIIATAGFGADNENPQMIVTTEIDKTEKLGLGVFLHKNYKICCRDDPLVRLLEKDNREQHQY